MRIKNKLLLRPEDFKPSFENWKITGVFNPAAVRLPNKKIFLYVRVAEAFKSRKKSFGFKIVVKGTKLPDLKNNRNAYSRTKIRFLKDISHFRKVILDDSGFTVEEIEQTQGFSGIPYESNYGVEDPRIVKIREKYLMTYVSVSSENGISTSLAISKDLKKWERKGIIFREQNKDVVLFPEKINKKYVALHRPQGFFGAIKPSIWISYSKDLVYWGREKSIIKPRKNSWDSEKIGSGPPPIKIKEGWLLIYHGVSKKWGKNIYCAGALLLDLKNPEKVIARTPKDKPLFKPEKPYEKKGVINNVVFPTGAIKDLNKKDLLIYSGAADKFVTVKKIAIKDILKSLDHLKENGV